MSGHVGDLSPQQADTLKQVFLFTELTKYCILNQLKSNNGKTEKVVIN